MRLEPIHPRGLYLAAVALLFLAIPVALFWDPGFFFFMEDDWPLLAQLVSHSFWQFLAMPDGEVWMPLSRAVYYGLAHTFGEGYSALLLINCLLSGVLDFLYYLFLRQYFRPVTALVLGLFYGSAAAHTSLTQVAFYNNALLCFIFFLLALLLTQRYLQIPSLAALVGISLCVWLSQVSWNFTILAVWALPLYIGILGGRVRRRAFWEVGAAVVLPCLVFALAYFYFAGFAAAASHNRGIIAGLPGPIYLVHWFVGAFLSPFMYLFWGHFHFPVWVHILGVGVLVLSVALIWCRGEPQERRLGFWALGLNALPIFLVSLARYQRGVNQAFAPRYAVYTLMGALIILGTAWGILKRRMGSRAAVRLLPLAVLAVMVGGQIFSLPYWENLYRRMSQASRDFYQRLETVTATPKSAREPVPPEFWYPERLHFTWGEAASIRRFLRERSGSNQRSGP